jgi:thiamine biosynthesis protein ThiS
MSESGAGPTDGEGIEVTVNGDVRTIDAGHTVTSFLESLELHPGLVVVERNKEILDRDEYDDVEVEAGDTLELVHFVGGG